MGTLMILKESLLINLHKDACLLSSRLLKQRFTVENRLYYNLKMKVTDGNFELNTCIPNEFLNIIVYEERGKF